MEVFNPLFNGVSLLLLFSLYCYLASFSFEERGDMKTDGWLLELYYRIAGFAQLVDANRYWGIIGSCL